LEKQHGRGPHCGTATKPWEDLFAEQGLNLKQQKSAGEYRQRERQKTPGIGRLAWKGMGHDLALAGNQTSTFNLKKFNDLPSIQTANLHFTPERRRFYSCQFE
jgi:hypothetical protein